MINNKIICAVLLMGLGCETFAFDLVEAYQRAQNFDPNWQAEQLQYETDRLNLGIAKGNLLPTITLNANVTRKSQQLSGGEFNIPGFDSQSLVSSTSTTKQISTTARQPLFRWDAWQGLKQVKTSVTLSEVNLALQQQQHILSVSDAYFNVLRQQALTLSYVKEEQALSEQLKMMQAKFTQGLVARSEVNEANAQYQSARANRLATQVEVTLAQERLAQLIGDYRENLAVLDENFIYQPVQPNDLSYWQQYAVEHNLELYQANLQVQYAADAKRVEQAAYYPQLEATASYGYTQQSPTTVMSADGEFDQVGLELNWTVFNGGQTQTNVKKADKQLQKAQAQREAVQLKVKTSLKQAYLQVEADQAKLQAREAAYLSAQSVSNASQAQYREGLKNMVDVLLAQRNAFAARQDYLNAQYDYLSNVLRFKAATGQLSEQDLTDLNRWLVHK